MNKETITLGGSFVLQGLLHEALEIAKVEKFQQSITPKHQGCSMFDSSFGSQNSLQAFEDSKANKEEDKKYFYAFFRGISASLIRNYYYYDFSKPGVLKSSMNMLLKQSVYFNHRMVAGQELGVVDQVSWQNGYSIKDESGKSMQIPAGINIRMKIDPDMRPNVVRALMSDPPMLHSNSVRVEFAWEQSHPDLSEREFYEKMGSKLKGKIVAKTINKIIAYHETSLVAHGADPFAQKIDDESGQINNPDYATQYQSRNFIKSFAPLNAKIENPSQSMTQAFSWVNIANVEGGVTPSNNNRKLMNKETIIQLLGLDTDISDADFSQTLTTLAAAKAKNTELSSQVQTLETQLTQVKDEKQGLENQLKNAGDPISEEDRKLVEIGKAYLKKLRDTTLAHYQLINPNEADHQPAVLNLISGGNFESVKAFSQVIQSQLEQKAPLCCNTCNSTDISRRSSIATSGDPTQKPEGLSSEAYTSAASNLQN